MALDEVYRTFLATSDLSTWVRCLEKHQAVLTGSPSSLATRTLDITHGAWIAMYVSWLSALAGDVGAGEGAGEALKGFTSALCDLHRRLPTDASRIGLASLVAWRGYQAAARRMLKEGDNTSAPLAILVKPSNPSQGAAFLRKHGLDEGPSRFPTAFYFYCDALVDMGRAQEVKALIGDRSADDPMITDLQGRIHERFGRWQAACEVYERSPWPMHGYRASMCRVIAKGPADTDKERLDVNDAMVDWMGRFDPEIGQAELARSSAFVNACRLNKFDYWVVQFELGKLEFRRRRYSGADAHFRLAAEVCPPGARFAILNARFANLTWLSDKTGSRALPMEPEALEGGYETIAAASDRDLAASASIRTWLAAVGDDNELLPPVFGAGDTHSEGRAHARLGDVPQAIRCWLRCVEEQHNPRVVQELIGHFARCRFARTMEFLVELALSESSNDFSAVWELGRELLSQRKGRGISSTILTRHVEEIASKLDELSQYEFQHLIRAFQFFQEAGRSDRAVAMLRRAYDLADGTEEHLSLAIARRKLLGSALGTQDTFGLICLRRAEREAGNRLEKLEVAREYLEYGQVLHGRQILKEAGIFWSAGNLEPAESIVALQCGRWMSQDELRALVSDAVAALERDLKVGKWRRYEDKFIARLLDAIPRGTELPPNAIVELRSRRQATDNFVKTGDTDDDKAAADGWVAWHTALVKERERRTLASERKLFEDMIDTLAARDLAWKLALWCDVAGTLDSAIEVVARSLPSTDPEKTPLRKSRTIMHDWRAQEVSDLWRKLFASKDEAEEASVREAIRAFYLTEQKLLAEWERVRREEASGELARALFLAECATAILNSLTAVGPNGEVWPVLNGIREAVAADAAIQLNRLEERVRVLRLHSTRFSTAADVETQE